MGRRCRQPVPSAPGRRLSAPRAGGGSAASQCLRLRVHAPKPHEQGAWVLRFGSVPAVVRIHGGRPTSRGRPPAAFFGGTGGGAVGCVFTHPSPARRGRQCRQPAPSAPYSRAQAPRAGGPAVPAASAFGSVFTRPSPTSRWGGRAACQCLWLRVHAPKPHEQGAWVLRFVSDRAVVRTDGERPTSRGRSPAAVFGGRGQEMGNLMGKRPGESPEKSLERPAGKPFGKPAGETAGKSPRKKPPENPSE